MKVLIVEDHPQMRQLIRAVIADLAEAVTECEDGAAAVAAYTAQKFNGEDSGADGFGNARRRWAGSDTAVMRRIPKRKSIIVTQYGDTHLRAAATQAGACRYVLKEHLLTIRQMLSNPTT